MTKRNQVQTEETTIDQTTTETETSAPVSGKALYEGKEPKDIFDMFGGEMSRGAVSRTIRELNAVGFTRGQIAKLLNKRYQHVRNVLNEPLKKS